MIEKPKEVYLTKSDAEKLRKLCKGCHYFNPKKEARHLCSIIGWYNKRNIDNIIEYVKQCPCNKKCLVKPSCREEKCPIWIKYVSEASKERNVKLMEERCKKNNSHATDA